jgi:hypothetical protein
MNRTTLSILAAGAALAAFAAPAQAAVPLCSTSNISPAAVACTGFFAGQKLGGNPTSLQFQEDQLLALGLTIDLNPIFGTLTNISGLSGAHSVSQSLMLYGNTWIGMHFGNGTGGPGNATAFYKLNAGSGLNLNTLSWAYNASSDLIVYKTGAPVVLQPVPEPASWAMLIAGMGTIGVAMRRRKTAVSFA